MYEGKSTLNNKKKITPSLALWPNSVVAANLETEKENGLGQVFKASLDNKARPPSLRKVTLSVPLPLAPTSASSGTLLPVSRSPDIHPHSLPETEAKALLKERQKKDNHNLSKPQSRRTCPPATQPCRAPCFKGRLPWGASQHPYTSLSFTH